TLPDAEIDAVPLLTADERARMLVEWNSDVSGLDSISDGFSARFEAQVKKTPDAKAVEFGGETLTYRGLEVRANQLARYLRARGVGPDVVVGLCMDRSIEMVVSLLAILKAEGAY